MMPMLCSDQQRCRAIGLPGIDIRSAGQQETCDTECIILGSPVQQGLLPLAERLVDIGTVRYQQFGYRDMAVGACQMERAGPVEIPGMNIGSIGQCLFRGMDTPEPGGVKQLIIGQHASSGGRGFSGRRDDAGNGDWQVIFGPVVRSGDAHVAVRCINTRIERKKSSLNSAGYGGDMPQGKSRLCA